MTRTDQEIVNWGRVAELTEEIGAEDFGEVVEIFLEECDGTAARLPTSGTLEADLHFLRGAAMNLGLDAMAAACQVGERAAAEGRSQEVDREALVRLYDVSRKTFLAGARSAAA
jgi:HPt (histidine-containing phosphotransfer) domain-containing protein